jgi:hypothetical protein
MKFFSVIDLDEKLSFQGTISLVHWVKILPK